MTVCLNFQANRHVGDLFIDLQDGLNLISLLEVLSGDQLVSFVLRAVQCKIFVNHYEMIKRRKVYFFFLEKSVFLTSLDNLTYYFINMLLEK